MGLDMYLTARRHVTTYDSEDSTQRALQALPFVSKTGMPVSAIEYRAMYWRKANAIHKWFVDNVQDGTDDCGTYDVSPQHLQDLRETCQQVLDDPTKALELLPPKQGFFFGSYTVDEYYMQDLRDTVEALDKALRTDALDMGLWFNYHASW